MIGESVQASVEGGVALAADALYAPSCKRISWSSVMFMQKNIMVKHEDHARKIMAILCSQKISWLKGF